MARTPPSADQILANWTAGYNATAQSKYKAAINRVTANPMALAAAKVQDGTWLAHTQAAQGKLLAKLQAADPGMWKSQASGPGATAWLAGAQKGKAKFARAAPMIAQAAQAASQAAAGASGPLEKVRAAINAYKSTFGLPTI